MLTERKSMSGTLEYHRTGGSGRYHPGYGCKWAMNTVVHILENRECAGCLVYCKTVQGQVQRRDPVEKRAVFENCHAPIVDRETWEHL